MKKALVFNGSVVQVEPVENIFPVSVGMEWIDCPDNCEAYRWSYEANTLAPIPVPVVAPVVPTQVTMRQARLALLQAGFLTPVNDAVAAMTGLDGEAARIEWEFSNTVDRDEPLTQSMAAVLGLTSGQIDALFIQAATL
jgi:hypothetical protein